MKNEIIYADSGSTVHAESGSTVYAESGEIIVLNVNGHIAVWRY